MKKTKTVRLINAEELRERWLFKDVKGRIYRETVDAMPTFRASPCNFCRYYPPTAEDGKPCVKCPAEQHEEKL